MAVYRPTQVFATVTTPQRVGSSSKQDANDENIFNTTNLSNREIQVTAVGEVSLPPDRCRVTTKVTSVKENVQDVKNSIQRRLDYVLQCLNNHGVKETDIQVYKHMKRVDTMYQMDAEIQTLFIDFHKCQTVTNLLVEKLDETVTVCLPEFFHASHTLENLRQQASLLAIHNAKQKAQEMARFVHLTVGRPITIREEESKEWEGTNESLADPESITTIHQRMAQNMVTVSCRVSACFELKPRVKVKAAK